VLCHNAPRVDFKPSKNFVAQTNLVFLLCNAMLISSILAKILYQNTLLLRSENKFSSSLHDAGYLSRSLSSTVAHTHAHTHTHTHAHAHTRTHTHSRTHTQHSQNFHHLLRYYSSTTKSTAFIRFTFPTLLDFARNSLLLFNGHLTCIIKSLN
jgi:hypothetical protein